MVYDDENLTFKELLDLDDSMTVHHKNIQKLAIEMFKIKNNLSPPLMKDIFKENTNTYDLRDKRCWEPRNVRTIHFGTETISYRGPKTWDMVPQHIKDAVSLPEFKSKIKTWKPNDWTCRLCKTFIPQLGCVQIPAKKSVSRQENNLPIILPRMFSQKKQYNVKTFQLQP